MDPPDIVVVVVKTVKEFFVSDGGLMGPAFIISIVYFVSSSASYTPLSSQFFLFASSFRVRRCGFYHAICYISVPYILSFTDYDPSFPAVLFCL